MAPEVLNGEILKDYVDNHFKSVLLTDVYSMCLIFWEVIQNIEGKRQNLKYYTELYNK